MPRPSAPLLAHGPCNGFLGKELHLHVNGKPNVLAVRILLALLAQIKAPAHGVALNNLTLGL